MTAMTTDPRHRAAPAGHPRHRPPGPATRWPHSDSLALGAIPSAPSCARARTREILSEWGLDRLADDTAQVVSELVTNAVKVTRAGRLDTPVRLTLLADQHSVLVSVWDGSPNPPVPRDATVNPDDINALAEDGRGLWITTVLADACDYVLVPREQGGGKAVRALLSAHVADPVGGTR